MKTAKLHELIQLAIEGKKFTAKYLKKMTPYTSDGILLERRWTTLEVTQDWEYQEIREPEVVEFECEWEEPSPDRPIHPYGPMLVQILRPMIGKKWKVVCTEVMDE